MALASSPAAVSSSTHHHTPRISVSSCFCPPSGARAPCPLRAATASSTPSSRSRGREYLPPPPAALPDPQAAAALLLAAAGTVGAASLLLRSSSSGAASQRQEVQDEEVEGEECPDCGGTGLCGRCKGEGFVFKQLSEETATRARKAAKNMATRYTSGLPTKWTYCNKCSSTRSCTTCRGSGRIITTPPVT